MTPRQADKIAAKVKDKRFGLLMENGNGVWIYECKTIKYYGQDCHLKRYRGSFWLHWRGYKKQSNHVYKGKDKWEGFTLAWELYRTDWKVTIITEAVLDAILAK
jgi:hypothetical protein